MNGDTEPTSTTRDYVLDEDKVMPIFRRLARHAQIRSSISMVIVGAVMSIVLLDARDNQMIVMFGGVILIYLGALNVRFSRTVDQARASLAENGWLTIPRHHEISPEFFAEYTQDGHHNKSRLAGLFDRAELRDGYYVLRFKANRQSRSFIPADAFASPADRAEFEHILTGHGVRIKT